MTRFLLSLLAATLLVAGCGNDGKSPAIKSFAASSTSLPEGGADVTFTWSVKREKTLELLPFPGLVTGTTATVNVTEPTTFTLLAKNSDGSARKKLSIAIGEPMTVSGQVLSYRGQPVPGVQVFVDEALLVTDENGEFTLDGVVPPYDTGIIATANDGGVRLTVFRDVTRPDPKLLHSFGSSDSRTGNVTGTVSGGVGFPYPTPTPDPGYETYLTLSSPVAGYMGTVASGVDGTFSADLYWDGEAAQPVAVNVVQYTQAPAVSFTSYGRATGTVTDQASVDLDVAMSAIGTGHISGAVTAPFEITSYNGVYGWADLGGSSLSPPGAVFGGPPFEYAERLYLPGLQTTNGDFSFAYPEIAGAVIGVSASVQGAGGNAFWIKTGFAGGETGVEAELPAFPVLLTPVQNANVSAATVFSVSPVDGAVYNYGFYSDGGFPAFGVPPSPSISIDVYSSSNVVSFPDPDLLAGLDPEGRFFEWNVYANVGYGNIDGIVENAMVPPNGEYGYSSANGVRTFTYGQPLPPF